MATKHIVQSIREPATRAEYCNRRSWSRFGLSSRYGLTTARFSPILISSDSQPRWHSS
jgi:hypothetical protein